MSKLNKYKFYIVGGLILLLGVSWYLISKNKTVVEPLQTAKVVKGDLSISFSIDGKLVGDIYEPTFVLGGKVNQVFVKEGDYVKAGQWIATLDTEEAQKNLEKLLRDYSSKRNDFEEITGVTYVNTVVTDTIRRILEKNQWDLEKAVIDVELKNIALKQSRLIAPVSGIVANLNIKIGDVVSTQNQTPIVTIVKSNIFSFVAYAEESDALKIDKDQIVKISFEAYDDKDYLANRYFLSPVAEIDSNGLTTYKVTAYLDTPKDVKLMDGMEGSILFITKEVKDVITIPNKAVYRENNKSYVDVINDHKEISKVEIETGFTDGKSVEVTKGLTIDQNVITRK
jgi:RND family efflux transporter MFP subunit